jgi:HSP20 family molecular chaperone IbpA
LLKPSTTSTHDKQIETNQRSFTLPRTVDPTRISASYRNGVLELTIPKGEEARSRENRWHGGRIAV